MHPDRFYDLIESARPGSAPSDASADSEELASLLRTLDDEDLLGFVRTFEAELARLNQWAVWGAGYVATGGMSDDAFHYFRAWLIGKGRDAVETALTEPDALADFLDGSELENEELEYVAFDLLEERDLDREMDEVDGSREGEPEGVPFDEDTVDRSFPRIAAAVA
ncbi:MAG TPA: DUF4240 domain-containing protein [Amnibacterium sp.]